MRVGFGRVSLAIVSGFLYAIVFLVPELFLLSWFAWIPLLFSIENQPYKKVYFLSLISGVVAYSMGMYWMAHLGFTYLGVPSPFHYLFLLLFSLVAAHFICLIFLLFQFLRKHTPFSDIFLLPVCFLLFSFYNPLTFHTAFGSSQSLFTSSIQAIEFTGVEGLSFLLVFFNIFIYKIFTNRKSLKNISYYFFFALLVFWFSYGFYASKKWNENYQSWDKKRVAVVQPNRLIDLFQLKSLDYSTTHLLEFDLMEKFSADTPLLTIWPEGYLYQYQQFSSVKKDFHNWTKRFNTHLLFVDNHHLAQGVYNSMFWLNNKGNLEDIYHKRVLVPFGEYLPFQDYYDWFLKWIKFPLGRFQEGKIPKTFSIAKMQVAPLICYESTDAIAAAQSIGKNGKGKIFVVSTNNGWYESLHQVTTHSMISNLRAVENRVPMIHTINNGYSSLTMPDGKVIAKTPYQQAGAWIFEVPHSEQHGGSFYSGHPLLLKKWITIVSIVFFLIAILRKNSKTQRKVNNFLQIFGLKR
jgi:apolipoprotein N-acyltransferase